MAKKLSLLSITVFDDESLTANSMSAWNGQSTKYSFTKNCIRHTCQCSSSSRCRWFAPRMPVNYNQQHPA